MTSDEISNRPILTLGGQDKEQNSPTEKQPALSDDNQKTKAEARSDRDFDAIYKALHDKFPTIINMDKPVLLAVGIRRKILKHLEDYEDITNLILNKWIKWYFRKSKYYSIHKVGAVRYNLDGTEAGAVTEKDQEKRDKMVSKIISNKNNLEDKRLSEKIQKDKKLSSEPGNAETKSH